MLPTVRRLRQKLLTTFFLLGVCQSSVAQVSVNTIKYDSTKSSPSATISQAGWMKGAWKGEAFRGTIEEVWAAPSGGSMVGTFKLIVNNKIKFYEIMVISEENGTLILRLKHSRPDLKGWEEKTKTIDFKLVAIDKEKLYFDGYTYEKTAKNKMVAYLLQQDKDGKITEEQFLYTK